MKKQNNKFFAVTTLLIMFTATLLSFTSLPGGDVIEIYVNKKMVVQKFTAQMASASSISLGKSNYADKISVWYGHCGLNGKSRKIIIKNAQGKVLKQMSFADAKTNNRSVMSFSAKNILGLRKENTNTLTMYYSSKELSQEKLLASISINN